MGSSDLITRSWNGQTIRMRHNRICLTDLCKAGETRSGNALRFSHWFESDATQRFLQHRSAKTGREVFAISGVIDNAENSALIIRESQRGDAWGDKVVGMRLAAQLCVELEHLVYEWFTEAVEQGSSRGTPQPTEVPALSPGETLDLIQRSYTMLQELGVADDRDRIRFGDMIRNTTARGAGGYLLPPADESMAISDALLECGAPPNRVQNLAIKFGKEFKAMYREEHGQDPPMRIQSVNGRPTKVCEYNSGYLRQKYDYIKDWLARHIG